MRPEGQLQVTRHWSAPEAMVNGAEVEVPVPSRTVTSCHHGWERSDVGAAATVVWVASPAPADRPTAGAAAFGVAVPNTWSRTANMLLPTTAVAARTRTPSQAMSRRDFGPGGVAGGSV